MSVAVSLDIRSQTACRTEDGARSERQKERRGRCGRDRVQQAVCARSTPDSVNKVKYLFP